MKHLFRVALFCIVIFPSVLSFAQSSPVVSGPMMGQVELRTAQVWLQVNAVVKNVAVKYWKNGQSTLAKTIFYKGELGHEFNTVKVSLTGLDYNSTYQYQFIIDGKPVVAATGHFTTQDLWQWRKPAPDFTFITGSCAYINDPINDRPGKPYGSDSTIFEEMAKEKASFMLWLGDNWYTRESDYFSEWGMHYRPSKDRSLKVLQPFLKAMPHYAIWDDHDYGPNDGDKSFIFKETSRKVFVNNWCNPSFGQNGQGIFSKVTYNDVDVFLMDDRWFRSNDGEPDSVNGQPNWNKRMYGEQQMEWFKNAIRQSQGNTNINFRIIATGSQVLNPLSPKDCFRHYPVEFKEMMDFLLAEKMEGVVFLTGDRHLSEINKINRKGAYPLYDITASPLTAGFAHYAPEEKNNPARVFSLEDNQNYARFNFTGQGQDRKLLIEFMGLKGEKLGEYALSLKDLSF
jgi:alkaline phosphatase D